MIPKIIHYCWFGKKPLPNSVKQCIKSWEKYCPDYEIKQWNEANFDINCHPFVKSAYEAGAWAFVSDYVRLKVVYDCGGIYFDTDVELLKSPDFLLNNECYIGVQQYGHLCTTGLGFGANCENSIVLQMLKIYDCVEFRLDNKNELACPNLNAKVFERLGYRYSDEVVHLSNVTVYPTRYFDPIAPGNSENLMCNETVSIHHYSATWTTKKNRFRRKILMIIGNKNVHKIKHILRR